jgi:hypothetical protein
VFGRICAITAPDVSGHIGWPAGLIKQGETTMRKFISSIATLAALITFAGMSSAVTVLSELHFAAPKTNADRPPPGDYPIDFESFLAHFPSP